MSNHYGKILKYVFVFVVTQVLSLKTRQMATMTHFYYRNICSPNPTETSSALLGHLSNLDKRFIKKKKEKKRHLCLDSSVPQDGASGCGFGCFHLLAVMKWASLCWHLLHRGHQTLNQTGASPPCHFRKMSMMLRNIPLWRCFRSHAMQTTCQGDQCYSHKQGRVITQADESGGTTSHVEETALDHSHLEIFNQIVNRKAARFI